MTKLNEGFGKLWVFLTFRKLIARGKVNFDPFLRLLEAVEVGGVQA
jgi:hypothetical protein